MKLSHHTRRIGKITDRTGFFHYYPPRREAAVGFESIFAVWDDPGFDFSLAEEKILHNHESFLGANLLHNLKLSCQKAKEVAGEEVSFVAGIFAKDKIYLYLTGKFSIYLFRNGKAYLLASDCDEKTLVGQVKEKDVVLILPLSFEKSAKVEQLARVLSSIVEFNQLGTDIEKLFNDQDVGLAFYFEARSITTETIKSTRQVLRQITQELAAAPPKSKKISKWIGFVMIGVLLLALIRGFFFEKEIDYRKSYQGEMVRIQELIENVPHEFSTDPNKAYAYAQEAEMILGDLNARGIDDPEIGIFEEKLSNEYKNTFLIEKVSLQQLVDLSLQAQDFEIDQTYLADDQLFVLDMDKKILVRTDIQTQRTEILAGPDELNDPLAMAVWESSLYVVDTEGVFDATEKEKVVERNFSDGVLLEIYGGSMYFWDPGSKKIFKSTYSEGTFSAPQEWLDESVSLSNPLDWVIDGSIWVLDDGKIIKLVSGKEVNFNHTPPPFVESLPHDIFTHYENENIFLLYPEDKMVVVLDKNGKYQKAYSANELDKAKSIVVSEVYKKIIFDDGKTINYIDL